jgi:hypothetical protein
LVILSQISCLISDYAHVKKMRKKMTINAIQHDDRWLSGLFVTM